MSDTGVKIVHDTITPSLARIIAACKNTRSVLEAMGAALVSVTVRAFRDEWPASWPPTKRGVAPLYRSGALRHSIRVISLTDRSVTVGTDRPYAVFHQFGVKPHPIRPKTKGALYWPGAAHPVRRVNHPGLPARPFFPFDASGRMTDVGRRIIEAAARAELARLLGAK